MHDVTVLSHLLDRKNIHLNLCVLMNSVGTYVFLPLLIVHLSGTQGVSVAFIAALATSKAWSQFSTTFVCAFLTNRYTLKRLMIVALALKPMVVCIMLFNKPSYLYPILIFINGFASALFMLSSKLYIRHTSHNLEESFSIRYTINNAGAAFAPLIVSALLLFNYSLSTSMSVILFILLIPVLSAFNIHALEEHKKRNVDTSKSQLLMPKSKVFFAFIVLASTLFSMLYFMFETALPLELTTLHLKGYIGFFLAFNALCIMVLQIPTYRASVRFFGVRKLVRGAFLSCILLFVPFFMMDISFSSLFLVVSGVTLCEIFVVTSLDSLIARSSENEREASLLYSFSGVFKAIGITLGSFLYTSFQASFLPVCVLIFIMMSFSLSLVHFSGRMRKNPE